MGAAHHVPEFLQKTGLSNFDGHAFDYAWREVGGYYLSHRHGPSRAATSKVAYLLRDTLNATGSKALGLSPASLAINFRQRSRPHGRWHWTHDQSMRSAGDVPR